MVKKVPNRALIIIDWKQNSETLCFLRGALEARIQILLNDVLFYSNMVWIFDLSYILGDKKISR